MNLTTFWCLLLLFSIKINHAVKEFTENQSLEVVNEKDERLLLFATLEGHLFAIEQQSGKIRWKIKEKPIVQVPLNVSDATIPIFLPDPKDGSLYLVGEINKEPMKKLPFTIPQLVSSSPCRSSDGILYTGKKKDSWFKLDPNTGKKQQIIGWDDHSTTCPLDIENFIYIGRTQYNLRMVNVKKPESKWNVTFYDYAATIMSKDDLNDYDLMHFTSTSTGKLVTLNRRRGTFLWEKDLNSPIIATYLLDKDGLIAVPFTSLANHTISYLIHNALLQQPNHMKLYQTLYVGEHSFGLYAIPSLVDQNVVTITPSDNGPLLITGPLEQHPLPGHNYQLPKEAYTLNNIIIFTGHYNIPPYSSEKIFGATNDMMLFKSEIANANLLDFQQNENVKKIDFNYKNNTTINWFNLQYKSVKTWINQQENKGLKLTLIVMAGCVVAMFWYLQVQVREMQNLSQNGSKSSQRSSYGFNENVTAISEELSNGCVKVGKITFNPNQLLGKGCEGTFVYRGEFDSRRVAVKRLLPECFNFADREVQLLRESDAHPNVIRYYCTEQDRMFRYIALELCQATLSDYVQGNCPINHNITPLEILRQATAGLGHLHSLDIVHRDIKPHNVLISIPNGKGAVRAMISDFGLCKKLQLGRGSFSRRSGVTGTDGWIAPEMLNGAERTTYAVDLFSLGCLYYYVLSNGAHPFGDSLRRQANILMGNYNLNELKGPDWMVLVQKILISALICSKPDVRPSCEAVLKHPIFWNCDTVLNFLQEVSDRIEKAESSDQILQELENDADLVVKKNWRYYIHEEVASDLKKYRTYQGHSVRDLLRALRNKKHHYRELSSEAQRLLGDNSETFTKYFMDKFPLLLSHTFLSMQCVANEEKFKNYYDKSQRYSIKYFKKHIMLPYVEANPLGIPQITTAEYEIDYNRKERVRNRKTDSPMKKVSNHLIKSGGLYRNFEFKKKSGKKKSDEPLVWVLDKQNEG